MRYGRWVSGTFQGIKPNSSIISYLTFCPRFRGLSPYTDVTTPELGFKGFGRIESTVLYSSCELLQTCRHIAGIQTIERTPHDGLFNAKIVYDRKDDAETAVEAMNTARSDIPLLILVIIFISDNSDSPGSTDKISMCT